MAADKTMSARDDLFVGGDIIDESIDNYEGILHKLAENNLKVTPRQLKFFPRDTVVFSPSVWGQYFSLRSCCPDFG